MKRLIIFTSLLALLVSLLAFPASAAIYDPYQNGSVTIDGENEIVSVDLALGNMFWQAYRNGTRFSTSYGQSISYSTKMADFDNEHVVCWVFGNDYYLEVAGIPSDSLIDCHMTFGLIVGNGSQTFDALGNLFLKTYDSNYQLIDNISVANDSIDNGLDTAVFDMNCEIPSVLLKGATYWRLDFTAEVNDVANESDTTIISVTCGSTDVSIEIPYSSLYQLQQQGEKTNKLLDDIDTQLQANGERLDDIIAAQQNTQNKLDEMATRPVTPVDPDGADDVEDFHDKESGLVGDAFDDFQQVDTLGDAIVGLRQRATAFLAVTWIFNLLSRDAFFADLLYISLAVGMFAAFLNIIIHSGNSGKDKAPKHRDNNPQKRIGGK